MTTPAQQAYIDLLVPGAQRAAREYPGTYASVCIGQAILETGWGRSSLGASFQNHLGIKWFGDARGPFPAHVTGVVEMGTWEKPDSGAYQTRALFRTYADPIGSCLDWAANLKATSAYAKAGAWEAKDADAFIRAIGKPYTGGDSSYQDKVLSLMDAHNLRQYDSPGGTVAITIPTIRENDPPVNLVNSHGEILRDSRGNPRKVCVCVAITFPLVEQEMIRRGLVKRTIDVFQGGYNKGGVAASAGTHDMGGVLDVLQGISREQRGVWADFGWMMFPRIPAYGWKTGDHGHGGVHGCVHRTASLAKQVRDGINGLDGLVSNTRRNFVAPSRTWQDAVRALTNLQTVTSPKVDSKSAPAPKPAPQVLAANPPGDDVPPTMFEQQPFIINHAATGEGWALGPEVFAPQDKPTRYTLTAYINGSEGTNLKARVVALHAGGWFRYREINIPAVPGQPTQGQIVHTSWTHDANIPVHIDVWADKPDNIEVVASAHVWRI